MTTVSGIIRDTQKAPLASLNVALRRLGPVVGFDGGAIGPDTKTFTTGGNGLLTMPDLATGRYEFDLAVPANPQTSQTVLRRTIGIVPTDAGDTMTLEEFLTESIDNITPALVQQATAAAAAAEAAAATATAQAGIAGGHASDAAGYAAEATTQANISTGAAILAGAPIAPAFPTDDAETAALASPFLFIAPEGIQSWTHTGTFASLTQGQYIPRIEFPTVTTMLASTATTLGPVGQIVEAEGFRYEVAASGATGPGIITTEGGVKLRSLDLTKANSFGPARDGAIATFGFAAAYSVSGTDAQPRLNAAIDSAILGSVGNTHISAGKYYLDDDLTIGTPPDVPDTFSTLFRNFTVSGDGKGSSWAWNSASQRLHGTALFFSPGHGIVVPNGRPGYVFRDMTIAGSVGGGALFDDQTTNFNGPFTLHGGMQNVLLLNHHTTAPAADTWAMSLSAVYGSVARDIDVEGRPNPSSAWSNTSNSLSDGMFYGGGIKLRRVGQGSGGWPKRMNIRGFDLGVQLGETAADWPTADQSQVLRVTMEQDSQIHFCNRGVFFGRGVSELNIEFPHLEQIGQHFVKTSGGGNRRLTVRGGSSATPNRTGPSGTERVRDGAFVCGDITPSENEWGLAEFKDHYFGFVTQAGVLTYRGATSGEIIIDGCGGHTNGGALVVVDGASTGKTPDILIRNWRGPQRGYNNFLDTRLVMTATISTDHSAHTSYVDARWIARIENCPGFGDFTPCPEDIDFSTRKYPPTAVFFNTTSVSRSITLGSRAGAGMEMQIEKRFAANAVNLVVPAGITLIDGAGTSHTDVTRSISTIGFYSLVRLGGSIWRTSAVFA